MADSKLVPTTARKPPNAGKGRKKGVPNKITASVKEAFELAFKNLQNKPGAKLDDWAEANPTDFYKIASKLIPSAVQAEVTGSVDHRITKIVREIVKPKSSDS